MNAAAAAAAGAMAESTLARFGEQSLLIVGDVGIDRYTIGDVERISQEAPVPIVRVTQETLKLGLAANVAENVRVLGASAEIVGVVGEDRGASDFRQLLKNSKLSDRHLVVDPGRRTVLKERIVSERQQLLRVDYEDGEPLSERVVDALLKQVEAACDHVSAIILEDYAKGLVGEKFCRGTIEIARKKNKWVAVDPNSKSSLEFYKGCRVITPNRKEAEVLTGLRLDTRENIERAGSLLIDQLGAEYAVLTLGKDGMAVICRKDRGASLRLIPTRAREVYDVSGAGDTVIATLTLALAAGCDITEAAELANAAAGVVVGKRGTATVTPAELIAEMARS